MEIINRLRLAIEELDRRDFYKYLIIVLSIVLLLVGFFVFRYYRNSSNLRTRIEDVNEIREDRVRSILRRMDNVERQRKQVNDILAKEKDFKIAGYFDKLLSAQGLVDNSTERSTSTIELDKEYREVILRARFVEMTMKQLCELLDAIEKKERVYAKSLEIIRSTKTPETIDVNMTIATLQPKLKRGK